MQPVDLVNLAADAIGARARCSSINPSDGSQLGDVGTLQYPLRIKALLRSAYWNCARRQTKLTLLKAQKGTPENPNGTSPTPPLPWLYEYQLPSDYLRARFIPALIKDAPGQVPVMVGANMATFAPVAVNIAIPFSIAIDDDGQDPPSPLQRVLLCNWQFAELVYTADVSQLCDLWDDELAQAAVATLASFFVNPLNRNAALAAEQAGAAKSLITAARVSDGNEGPSSVDHVPDWISIRGVGDYYGDWNGMIPFPWASIALGDGTVF